MDPSVQIELNAWGELLQTAAVAAEAATAAAGKRWGGRFWVAKEVAGLFKEPLEYIPGEGGRKDEAKEASVDGDDDDDDARSIPDLEPAEKWGMEIPEGFEEEFGDQTEDPSLLRCMALATMRCDDGERVWDEGHNEEAGQGREGVPEGRKRKRDAMEEEEEEGWEVVVAARKMWVKEKKVQAEMSTGATMRKMEAVKGVERSGRRPELGGDWEGRKERLVAWESMGRIKRNNRNKSKAGKRKTGNQKRWARENRGEGASQQQQQRRQQQHHQQPQRREEEEEEAVAGSENGEEGGSGSRRSPIRAPTPTVASTPAQQQQQQQQRPEEEPQQQRPAQEEEGTRRDEGEAPRPRWSPVRAPPRMNLEEVVKAGRKDYDGWMRRQEPRGFRAGTRDFRENVTVIRERAGEMAAADDRKRLGDEEFERRFAERRARFGKKEEHLVEERRDSGVASVGDEVGDELDEEDVVILGGERPERAEGEEVLIVGEGKPKGLAFSLKELERRLEKKGGELGARVGRGTPPTRAAMIDWLLSVEEKDLSANLGRERSDSGEGSSRRSDRDVEKRSTEEGKGKGKGKGTSGKREKDAEDRHVKRHEQGRSK